MVSRARDEMKRMLQSDWLAERERWVCRARFLSRKNKCLLGQLMNSLLTRMALISILIFDFFSVLKAPKKNLANNRPFNSAESASGQDEANPAFWLATNVGAARKFHFWPCETSFIDQARSVFFWFTLTSTSSRPIKSQKRTCPISSDLYRLCFVLLCIWEQFPSTSPLGLIFEGAI